MQPSLSKKVHKKTPVSAGVKVHLAQESIDFQRFYKLCALTEIVEEGEADIM